MLTGVWFGYPERDEGAVNIKEKQWTVRGVRHGRRILGALMRRCGSTVRLPYLMLRWWRIGQGHVLASVCKATNRAAVGRTRPPPARTYLSVEGNRMTSRRSQHRGHPTRHLGCSPA